MAAGSRNQSLSRGETDNVAPGRPVGIADDHARQAGGPPAGLAALIILGTMIVAAFFGVLGGTPATSQSAEGVDVRLTVTHPHILRSGMFFETSVELTARAPITDATIAMSAPLWKSITINTEMPQASEEEFAGNAYRLHFGALRAGERITLKLDSQINPDLFAGTEGIVSAYDGNRLLVKVPVETRVLP